MLFNAHTSFIISDRSYMSSAKRDIAKIAAGIGFNDEQKGKIDIIVAELSSNLIKHNAVNGEILVKQIEYEQGKGIEILSLDNGPGMKEPLRMMEDGVSTYGSKGEGLGAIKRLSDDFDLYSQPATGTILLSRIYIKKISTPANKISNKKTLDIKVVMVPKAGETLCGDGWAIVEKDNQLIILATDGLGHGKDAHIASVEAANVFKVSSGFSPAEVLNDIHNSIRKTRGIVAGMANIDLVNNTLTYCGVGNISGKIIYSEGNKSLISYNGTIGHVVPKTLNNHFFNWQKPCTLILHSDGIKSRWDMSKYPGLERHDTSIVAAALYKDNTRVLDDAMVVIARN